VLLFILIAMETVEFSEMEQDGAISFVCALLYASKISFVEIDWDECTLEGDALAGVVRVGLVEFVMHKQEFED